MLHPLLETRWSPLEWDAGHRLRRGEVESVVEAARWAPSAGNAQPWAFVIGCRGDETHDRLVRHLAGSARRWAPDASLLVANLCHRFVDDTDWDYSEFALYDLGQAVAHMTIQARALDLQARQFRAFDRDAMATEFDVPASWEVTSMTAFGQAPPGTAPRALTTPEGDTVERDRRDLRDLAWPTRRETSGT